jgi:UDP-N-acetylmuramyl tripeptide synthase
MTRSVLLDAQLSIENIIALLRSKIECGAHLHMDSREVRQGDVFVAVPGHTGDGRNFIAAAIEQGAAAVLTQVDSAAQWQAADF